MTHTDFNNARANGTVIKNSAFKSFFPLVDMPFESVKSLFFFRYISIRSENCARNNDGVEIWWGSLRRFSCQIGGLCAFPLKRSVILWPVFNVLLIHKRRSSIRNWEASILSLSIVALIITSNLKLLDMCLIPMNHNRLYWHFRN